MKKDVFDLASKIKDEIDGLEQEKPYIKSILMGEEETKFLRGVFFCLNESERKIIKDHVDKFYIQLEETINEFIGSREKLFNEL